ncbi:MAG: hypothetical protein ABIR34_13760 [Marmoricola sp.]
MGAEATKSVRAQQREVAARVERLITTYDQHRPLGPHEAAGRRRIKAAVHAVHRALRARDAAQAAVEEAEVRAGVALLRINDEGLSLTGAFHALGLSRGVGRRLVQAAQNPTRHRSPALSTDQPRRRAPCVLADHGETGTPATGGAMSKGSS